MEMRGIAHWALGMALGLLFLPSTSIALQATPDQARHLGWNEVVGLMSSSPGPIDAQTVEHLLGVKMARKTRAADDYDAWIPGRDAKSGAFLTLNYKPSQYKGYAGKHVSTLQIFVMNIECISPARMRDDLLRAGFTSDSSSKASTTLDFYSFGKHRSLRATYPTWPAVAASKVWAIDHHATDEDRRCVEDVLVTETD